MTIESLEPGRVLVTGATGFLGRHLTRSLQSGRQLRVRVLARSMERIHEVFGEDAEPLDVVPGDVTDETSLGDACRNVDVIFHCAALGTSAYGPNNRPEDYGRINQEGTAALAAEARRAGVRRFVHVSSTGAMGAPLDAVIDEQTPCRPASAYQRSKRDAELRLLEMCRDGFPAVILRPCLITGEGKRGGDLVRLFRLCRRGLFPVFGHRLDVQKPLVSVDDVVDALVLAATRGRPGEIYLVHSGGRHTLGQILDVAGRLVGKSRPYLNVPLPLARVVARLSSPLARMVGRTPPLSTQRLELFLADRRIVIDKARRELGYEPRHQDLNEMLGRVYRDLVQTGQL
jgi:nucleoside-diphosphate-sugar epimerase